MKVVELIEALSKAPLMAEVELIADHCNFNIRTILTNLDTKCIIFMDERKAFWETQTNRRTT